MWRKDINVKIFQQLKQDLVEPMFLPNHLQISITEILFHESKKIGLPAFISTSNITVCDMRSDKYIIKEPRAKNQVTVDKSDILSISLC